MTIHLLTPSIMPGDAVSHDVRNMQQWFRSRGYPAEVYARYCHRSLRDQVQPLRAYRDRLHAADDVLVYHHSVGWPDGYRLYRKSRNRKVVRFHNITPAAFFRTNSPGHFHSCRRGARETRWLLGHAPELLLPTSPFSAGELIALGAAPEACRTVPPLHDIGGLDALPLDETLAAAWQGRRFFLFVGRLAPNKGQLHLVRAFAHYRHYLGGEAHLVLVGHFDRGLSRYHTELRREVRRQRVPGLVHFVGKVSARQLRTYYALASLFLCASEHEGFCVPLCEAMHYGIPIVAYGSSAVGGTLGDAGLVWESPAPALLAESARLLEERPDVRETLVQSQRARFANHFRAEVIVGRLAAAMDPFLNRRA